MASTGKAALDVSVFAAIVQAEMVPELRPAMTSREFLRFATGGASTVASFPLWTDPGSAEAPTDDLSEIASTALADTQVAATAAEVGFRVDVTDLIRETTSPTSTPRWPASSAAALRRSGRPTWPR